MKLNKDLTTVKYVQVGDILKGKSFKSFDSLRRSANKIVKPIRENWLNTVLIKNSIFVNFDTMTRREIVEIFEDKHVRIINEENICRVYCGDVIIGEWDNTRKVVITKRGKLAVRIRYAIA